MHLGNIIQELALQNRQVVINWDTTKDMFLCTTIDVKTKKTIALVEDLHDFIVDVVIDRIVFGTEPREYIKGKGELYFHEGQVKFSYTSNNKFKRHSEPELITLDFAHPTEIEKNLNRSHLIFELSINDRGFMRQDIKPSIDEGDAYTLGTHVLEKYRSYFQQTLQRHMADVHKNPGSVEYELVFTGIVRALWDKTFLKTVYWFDVFDEQKTLIL
ncbi:MAG TPA: hypothetical protein VL947_10890 [Cytophagales bacterium]|nr:hypothetical protein [Cytophagales bacterium]